MNDVKYDLKKWLLLVPLLLLGFGLRFVALDAYPPGLRYDELQNYLMASRVLDGERPFYFAESWGHEPLYHYTQAGAMALFGESDWSLRLPSVLFGLFELAMTWLVANALFGKRVGLVATAMLTVAFWAIFYSRVGSRVGSVTPFACFLVFCVWRIGVVTTWQRYLLAVAGGVAAGVMMMLYVAGRVALPLVIAFAVYLTVFHRDRFRRSWLPLLILVVVGWGLSRPMFQTIAETPDLEQRIGLIAEPLEELRQGNVQPVLKLTAQALGIFVWQGEDDWLFNVAKRPIFAWFTAVFFLIGVGVSVRQWRKPEYALLLLFWLAGTGPSMVVTPAASVTHAIVAQPAAYILWGVGFVWVWQRWLKRPSWLAPALAIALFAVSAVVDGYAYFETWTHSPEVVELHQAGITAVSDDFMARGKETAVIAGPFINYWHPWNVLNFELTTQVDTSQVRWFNPAGGLIWPNGENVVVYFPVDPLGKQQFDPALETLFQQDAVPLQITDKRFTAYELTDASALDEKLAQLDGVSDITWSPDWAHLSAPVLPLNFGDRLSLLAVEVVTPPLKPGENLRYLTYWEVISANPSPVVSFTHVTSDGFDIWGQQDWLDVRMAGLQPGDRFVQVHTVMVQPDTPPGVYHIQLGLYGPDTQVRLPIVVPDSEGSPDRVWVGNIEVIE